MKSGLPPHFSRFPVYRVPPPADGLCVAAEESARPRMLCVLHAAPEADRAERTAFLEKVFEATGHRLFQDLGVLFLPEGPAGQVRFTDLKALGPFDRFFLLGPTPGSLGLRLRLVPYDPVPWQGATLLFTDPPEAISADRNLKIKLWESLKTVFGMRSGQ
jgi:hypothetical protein